MSKATPKYRITRIRSDADDGFGCLWVSVFFTVPPRSADVLHIVCPTDDDLPERRDMRSVYLERYDQSLGCYRGAKTLDASMRGIRVSLTPYGVDRLQLPREFVLVAGERLVGWKKARELLRRMSHSRCGRVMRVIDA
jgi:hypothetical protein